MRLWKEEFQGEIKEISSKYNIPTFRAFIFWYIKATEDLLNEEIQTLITDGPKDGGIDAIYIDHDAHRIKIYQSKFSQVIGEGLVDKDEIAKFCKVCEYLENSTANIQKLREYINPTLKDKLDDAIRYIKEEGYKPELIFITTHSINRNSSLFDINSGVKIISARELEQKFLSWQQGHTPELGDVEFTYLDILNGPSEPKGFIANIPSANLKSVYMKHKEKLFSRNVRIFYGESGKKRFSPNPKIKETLLNDEHNFWYFNNGITILSEKVTLNTESKSIILTNPQIINGCQTVTIIGDNKESEAALFAKIIEIGDHVINQEFIDEIIEANNRQNPVDERILKSNHPLQVKLQRRLEPLGYYYERKEGQYKEQLKLSTIKKLTKIDNRDLVKANVATISQPHHALDDENELFSTRFAEVFKSEKSQYEYLIPYLLWHNIKSSKPSYVGSKEKRSVFKLASWHILRVLYDNCSYLHKDFYLTEIAKALKGNKFELDDRLLSEIFEKIYSLYKLSEQYGENSGQRDFFKNSKTYEEIHNKIPKYLASEIEEMFD